MKRLACFLLAALFAAAALTGCGLTKKAGGFTAENEIFTYQKIDPQKTQLVVSRTGNIDVESLCIAFETQNPDIQVIYIDITGGNDGYKPISDWITKGFKPDVVVSAAGFFGGELTAEHFENLSTSPLIESYEAEALKRAAINDDVYCLPGPSDISAMMYNKTMFEQYGWEVPATFDEFVALCDQITEDTNGEVEPWNPNAKYSNELLTAMEAFTYEELFGGVENRAWYNDFVAGNATFAGHMEPYFEALQTLIEHNILREEHFAFSATERGNLFESGKIAMINVNIYDADNDQYDFSFMPFPTTKGETGYICDSYSCYVGVPIKEHTDAQREAIDRFLEFFSSADGQQAYIAGAMKVSNVKNVPLNQSDDLAALQPAISAGHMFERMDFVSATGLRCNLSLHKYALDMASGAATAADCIKYADAEPYSAPDAAQPPETVATASANMTVLETSFYIADMYREKAGADIGLIENNVPYRGNLMRMFAGDITPNMVTVLKPRSFANDSTLIKVSMTGQQILDALNDPLGNDETADCIYAFSGLKCTVAPWNDLGSKYLSVKLADGSELQMDKLYTVAVWAGTVAEEYITETLETYEGTWEELMTAKLKNDGTISPANDGRIKLVWD